MSPPRRLALAAVASVAVAFAPGFALAQRVLSMATLAPPGSLPMRVLDSMNRELRRRTGATLAFRWYAGGVQGDESEVVRKIRSGRLDGGALSATGLAQVFRPVLAFQLPAVFRTPEGFVRSFNALRPELEAGFERAGFSILNLSPATGPRMFSTREIRSPDDLRAARPWRWTDDPILPALYAETGATGVPLALPEVLGALQTGRVDTVFAPPSAAIALQWSGHVRFMSERASSGSMAALVLSRTAAQSLTPAQRATIAEVIAQATTIYRPAFLRADGDAVRALESRGVRAVALTAAERQRWIDAFARVRSRIGATLPDPAWLGRVQSAGGE